MCPAPVIGVVEFPVIRYGPAKPMTSQQSSPSMYAGMLAKFSGFQSPCLRCSAGQMLKSAGDGVVLEIVSLPVVVSKLHEYELAVKVVPVFN
jgi:hypothetical protein